MEMAQWRWHNGDGTMEMAHQRAYDNGGHDDGRHRPLQGTRSDGPIGQMVRLDT
jgi:hypothetical protein